MTGKDLGEMKISQLKGGLLCGNARLYGSKAELVWRGMWAIICAYDVSTLLHEM